MKKKLKIAYVSPVVKVAQFNVEKGYAGSNSKASVGGKATGWSDVPWPN